MKKIKSIWNNLTISQFDDVKYLLETKNNDWKSLLEIFGYDLDKLSTSELLKIQTEIQSTVPTPTKLKSFYIINGTRYNINVNLSKLTAGQFIDWQLYSTKGKVEELLTVFLIPSKYFFISQKYGSYDIEKVKNDLLNYMKYEDAYGLVFFLVKQSTELLKTSEKYLTQKQLKMEKKMIQKQLDNQ